MEPIYIYQSPAKNIALGFVSGALAAASYLLGADEWVRSLNALGTAILLYAGTTFFGLTTLYAVFRLAIRKPSIAITDQGMADYSTITSIGLIPWVEIDRIFYQKKGRDEYWGVALKKPEEYMRGLSFWKRPRMAGGRADDAVINISYKQIPLSIGKFIAAMREAHPTVRVHYPFPVLEGGGADNKNNAQKET